MDETTNTPVEATPVEPSSEPAPVAPQEPVEAPVEAAPAAEPAEAPAPEGEVVIGASSNGGVEVEPTPVNQ